jgi:hypothetical protein
MESGAALGVEGGGAIAAAVASVAGFVDELAGVIAGSPAGDSAAFAAADPLQHFAEGCLDGLSLIARIEAATAAAKVELVAGYTSAAAALEDPASTAQWAAGQEMAVVAEVAGVLTIGERAAGTLIRESQALTTALPVSLEALRAGQTSWQNARIMVDETTGLDSAGAAALEAHFLGRDEADPDAPAALLTFQACSGSRAALPGTPAAGTVPAEGAQLAGTPPPALHRKAPREGHDGPAHGVHTGPGRHGLDLPLPPGRLRMRDLEPHHRPRPRTARA